ncbi:O-antigen ligase family protein [Mycolicibacterium phlei]|uniref:O-antigen ligase family protein n=1 Tax=Mycolicibacterium phlei TaxID=1771 RepID=UPI00025AEDFC|nr:O-antigen ligase family protein [Mycolicibacterium phlei]EID15462.1 hypothetical protein MPHLEI_08314 [Mycolicibacterium phlei RIVM601174]MBF4191228.1 hypothetical protein [Mycolicibacterium phlei]
METVLGILLALLAILSLIASRHVVGEAWRSGWVQAAAAQMLVAGGFLAESLWVSNRQLIQLLTLAGFSAAVCLGVIGARGRDLSAAGTRLPLILIIGTWGWMMLVNVFYMFDSATATVLTRGSSGVLLILFLIGQMRSPITIDQFYSAALMTLSAIALMVPFMTEAFQPCTAFKCGIAGSILEGPYSSGNFLGLGFAILGGLVMLTSLPLPSKMMVLTFAGVALIATVSRTSAIALAIAVVTYLLAGVLTNHRAPSKLMAGITAIVVVVVPTVMGVRLIYTSGDDALSNRGRVWTLGRLAIEESPFTGAGVDAWAYMQETGEVSSRHFTHSLYLFLLFSGGAIALIFFVATMARLVYNGIVNWESIGKGTVLPIVFLICGMTEGTWNPLTVDGLTWIFLAVIAASGPRLFNSISGGEPKDQVAGVGHR